MISGNFESEIDILATYLDNSDWPSPIGIPDLANWAAIFGKNIAGIASTKGDGTYTCQLTIFRAGSFTLNVKVNGLDVRNSPWNVLEVRPTTLYAPSCVPLDIPTTMIAGTQYQFTIQGRDFYSNNVEQTLNQAVGIDFSAIYSGPVNVTATMSDHTSLGVFKVQVTF